MFPKLRAIVSVSFGVELRQINSAVET